MKTRSILLFGYLISVLVILLLVQGNLTVTGLFLIFFNPLLGATGAATFVSKGQKVKPERTGASLSTWYANVSSVVMLSILLFSLFQVSRHVEPPEIALLFVGYVIASIFSRFLSRLMFNLTLEKFDENHSR